MSSQKSIVGISLLLCISLVTACAVDERTQQTRSIGNSPSPKTDITETPQRFISTTQPQARTIGVSDKRLALVIGNANYSYAPLENTVNDANAMASTLEALGFEVIKQTNLNFEGMKQVIRDYGKKLLANTGSTGLFFFAGHGVSVKGVNYLVPIGEGFSSESDIEDGAVNIDMVMRRLEEGNTNIGFIILDACRNNPFAETASRSLHMRGRGLARMDAPSGTLVAYATAPGSTASDGDGKNGLYTSHLIHNLRLPGLTAEQVFKRTREEVEKDSMNEQSPREESSLKGADFYFLPVDKARVVNPEAVELTYWDTIKSSADPSDYQQYLKDYPDGKFASLAKISLKRLSTASPGVSQAGVAYTALNRGDSIHAEDLFKRLAESSRADDKARGLEGLADLALGKGDLAQATQLIDNALKLRPQSSTGLFLKARIADAKGDTKAVSNLLASATSSRAEADFPWQKAEALVAKGNLQRSDNPVEAKQAYEAAMKLDTQSVEAVTNLATLLRDGGQPEKALDLLKKSGNVTAMDRIADSLAYQIQQDLQNKNDQARQKQIDESVKELMARQKETRGAPTGDGWTTPPIVISVLGFAEKSSPLVGRIGMDSLLGQELERVLRAENVLVVDRALIDKVLNELKLGSSSLADPETQLKLGRLTAARLIAVGNLYHLNGKDVVSYRLIDTETTQIVHAMTENISGQMDPTVLSETLAKATAGTVAGRYPTKGRIAMVNGDEIILNLGSKHGLLPGNIYQVLGEPKVIEFQGKIIGKKDADLGQVRIASVEEQMAYAVPVERKGDWESNLRVQQVNVSSTSAH